MKTEKQYAKIQCEKCKWITKTKSTRKYITCSSCRNSLKNPLYKEPKYFEIWHSDGNDRTQLARVKAFDIKDVVNFSLDEFLTPEAKKDADIDISYEDTAIINLNVCSDCEFKDKNSEECNFCELSETLTVELDTYDKTEHYKTIFGTDDFYDLTKPKPTKNKDWNPFLKKNWDKSPEKGLSALILNTIEELPQLTHAFSKELIEKSKKDVEE